ncbi:Magnesium-translocating P-type ATPase [Rhodoferax ferrireducens T118]|uniref:Magnesium-transporting ATPase, P-type 1 n=1 Tax=Albidiferax ferrireducens (strain ATCC BAA-621 / DSM 15236 / T118) TaxID=338969 RepID=Q221Q8_ALBFT|nr:magnesium-translocating P-type ATPase [Rhodoferax ferrireducens]ABD68245.1 Magnesium-translocating P-type ATPase [Rhodoferax ferrireducens T118]
MNGLTSLVAAARLRQYGPNRLQPARQRALLLQFLAHFKNPLVLVLLAASGLSALTGDVTGALIIGVIVLMSVTLDFVQSYRAGRAAEQLALQVAITATVLRDGQRRELPVTELVPGDVVLLSAGNLVPADARLLEADDFFVNQAQLTGEPYPVEKRASLPDQADAEQASSQAWALDAADAVFMGSSVVSGSASVLIGRTGSTSALGQIAVSLADKAPPTAFEIGTRHFGMLIMRLTFLLVLFTLLVNVALHRPLLESFLFAVALAVGLTPELLPMVVSVTLTRGALRMAALKVIVKRPSAIQDMGAMDVLCTDKTGTLTEAKIRLERHVDAGGQDDPHVLELAYLNSYFESGLKSPLDDAILAHGEIDVSAWTKIDEVPFDFERRRVSVLVQRAGARRLVVKGAPEDIVRLCTHYQDSADATVALDAAARVRITQLFDSLSEEGFRVLGIASRDVPGDHPHAMVSDESELVFAGFAAFLDPPKASAGEALKALAASGVAVKIVTGDNERVTRHVCTQLGVAIEGVLTGTELAALNDDALRARVEGANLFCRVNPAQKNRILLALKGRGHVVGYLGDGINDAPSLHTADVGISVEGAVDVAKQAAAMILLERDLMVLHQGILEGRRTFGNVMKYIMMATSSNFGNMFSMAAATLFLPFLPMLPMQILLNNLMYDVSEITLPMDNVDEENLAQPKRWDMTFIRNFMLTIGPISSLFDFLTFYLLLSLFNAHESLFRTGWFVESIATQVLVIFVIRTRRNPLRSHPNRWLVLTSLGVVVTAMLLPFTPLAPYLGFTPLPLSYFGLLGALVVAYLLMVEGGKQWFYRRATRA